MRTLHLLAIVLIIASGLSVVADRDGSHTVSRIRLILSTTAATASVTVDGATLASYRPSAVIGSPGLYATHTGRTLQLSRNVAGEPAEATFDVILDGVPLGSAITWHVDTSTPTETQLEVALGDATRPVLVDRFESSERAVDFTTWSDVLLHASEVAIPPIHPLVLAHYYPWYTLDTWRDARMADQPLQLYSIDDTRDVARLVQQAVSAGIDVFVSSWREWPQSVGDPSDRSMRVLLDAARPTPMKVCVYTESFTANPALDWSTAEPQTMERWLADIVDRYASDPAYLRINGRPVIFVYAASLIGLEDWGDVITQLRASGRNPLLVGDFYESRLIENFDGQYRYSTVSLSKDDLLDVYAHQSLRARTFGLLQPGDSRRIWVASVTPGADDTKLMDRDTHLVVDRAGGHEYDDQWATAIRTGADWVIVTNWNEWWENTEIEPSQRYGTVYLAATRKWAELFKNGRTSCGSCGGSTPESGNRREEVAVAGGTCKDCGQNFVHAQMPGRHFLP